LAPRFNRASPAPGRTFLRVICGRTRLVCVSTTAVLAIGRRITGANITRPPSLALLVLRQFVPSQEPFTAGETSTHCLVGAVLSAHLLDCSVKLSNQPSSSLVCSSMNANTHARTVRGSTRRWIDPSRSAANTMPPPTGECFAGSVIFGGPHRPMQVIQELSAHAREEQRVRVVVANGLPDPG
jgi:hypothetical protein